MRKLLIASVALTGLLIWRNRGATTGPNVMPPGRDKKAKSSILEAGAALLQGKKPLQALNMYLNGFHFYADDLGHQMEAHHYCTQINEDSIQCVIFDGNTKDARLIGIEYIVSEPIFRTFTQEEKRLWHSHHYEVKSGTLIAPGIPPATEHELMEKLVTTYGKIWHTWDTANKELPLGIPALMMGFTADGQMKKELEEDRDRRFNISTSRRRLQREDIVMPELVPGANAWKSGRTNQLILEEKAMPTM